MYGIDASGNGHINVQGAVNFGLDVAGINRYSVDGGSGLNRFNGTLRSTSRFFGTSVNLNKDSVTTSSAGSVLPLGIDTATGNVVKVAGIISGTYTPTTSNLVNLSSATANQFLYSRVGDIVTVTGSVSLVVTSTGATTFQITLPITTNMNSIFDANGVATTSKVKAGS